MKIRKHLGDVFFAPVDLTNSVHRSNYRNRRIICSTALSDRSLAQHDLDPKPQRADETGRDHGDHSLERVALRLLHTLAPASQMLEICPQLPAILLLNPERGKDGQIGRAHV